MDLARLGSLSGVGPRKWLRFTQQICWLREATASISFSHGGVVIKEGGAFVDLGGYLTAVSEAVDSAKFQCETYGITGQSSLIASVSLSIVDTPRVLCERPEYGFTLGHYFVKAESEDSAWFIYSPVEMQAYECASSCEEQHAAWASLNRLGPVEIHSLGTVWSSHGADLPASQKVLDEFIHAERNAVQVLIAENSLS